jgi:NADH dehydrogenase FAD-containing subunit
VYGDKVEFVLGTASKLEPSSKTVTISTPKGDRTQAYDILIIATGAHSVGDVPWKASLSGYQATVDTLHKIQEQVKAAKTIVVGGAGPTGVETSGELGYEYGKDKEITLVCSMPILSSYANSQVDHCGRQCPRHPSTSRLTVCGERAEEAKR